MRENFDLDSLADDAMKPEASLVAVDSRKNPNIPQAPQTEDDFPGVNWNSDFMRQRNEMDALIDKDFLLCEIARLSPKDAKTFDQYCESFDSTGLPHNVKAWYETREDITKMTWLYLRWECMRDHMRLAGHEPVNTLLDHDRLCRALQAALENPKTRLADLPGFALSVVQQSQVRRALLDSPQLVKWFPDVASRFETEEKVNSVPCI